MEHGEIKIRPNHLSNELSRDLACRACVISEWFLGSLRGATRKKQGGGAPGYLKGSKEAKKGGNREG